MSTATDDTTRYAVEVRITLGDVDENEANGRGEAIFDAVYAALNDGEDVVHAETYTY
jgi:hypothetical protein